MQQYRTQTEHFSTSSQSGQPQLCESPFNMQETMQGRNKPYYRKVTKHLATGSPKSSDVVMHGQTTGTIEIALLAQKAYHPKIKLSSFLAAKWPIGKDLHYIFLYFDIL
jgi:hypothetical protein